MNSKIPKRIIQIWGGGELPRLGKASAVNLKLLNPDFEYLFFDDNRIEELINNQFKEYRSIFQSFTHAIQRYDFFRYLAVYHFGGFYFDCDVLLYEKLKDLLEYSCVFTFEKITISKLLMQEYKMGWDIGNYAFGAAPEHPFLGAIIENCVKAQINPEWSEVMVNSVPWLFRKDAYVLCTTGPMLVSRTYAENKNIQSAVKILFLENIYDRNNWYQFGTYGTHIMKSTWRKRRNKLHNYIWNYWYQRTENKNIQNGQNDLLKKK